MTHQISSLADKFRETGDIFGSLARAFAPFVSGEVTNILVKATFPHGITSTKRRFFGVNRRQDKREWNRLAARVRKARRAA